MKDSIRRKLEKLDERFEEIGRLLSEPEIIARQNQFRDLSMEYARLGPLVDRYRGFVALEGDAETARELAMDEELTDSEARCGGARAATPARPERPLGRQQYFPRSPRRYRRR
jgi:peptide chain release factor 1